MSVTMRGPQDEGRFPHSSAGAGLDQPMALQDRISFSEILGILYEGRWAIIAAVVIGLVAAYLFLQDATPRYRAEVTLQVQSRMANPQDPLFFLQSMSSSMNEAPAEMEVVRSRTVMEKVVESLGLALQVQPVRFPIIGKMIAQRHSIHAAGVRAPVLGMSSYGWGDRKSVV